MPDRVVGAVAELQGLRGGRRIDWERLIMDIQRSAWLSGVSATASLAEISRACGRNDTWAWQLKNVPDTEPKFHDGLMLLGLWADVTGKAGEEVPILGDFKGVSR